MSESTMERVFGGFPYLLIASFVGITIIEGPRGYQFQLFVLSTFLLSCLPIYLIIAGKRLTQLSLLNRKFSREIDTPLNHYLYKRFDLSEDFSLGKDNVLNLEHLINDVTDMDSKIPSWATRTDRRRLRANIYDLLDPREKPDEK